MEPTPPRSRLDHAVEQQQLQATGGRQTTAREFATAEELIRFDAAQHSPPPALAERVRESVSAEPQPLPPPWWKRLFGF